MRYQNDPLLLRFAGSFAAFSRRYHPPAKGSRYAAAKLRALRGGAFRSLPYRLEHRHHAVVRHEGNVRILALSLGALEQAHGDQPDADDFGGERPADLLAIVAIDVALLVKPLAEPLRT